MTSRAEKITEKLIGKPSLSAKDRDYDDTMTEDQLLKAYKRADDDDRRSDVTIIASILKRKFKMSPVDISMGVKRL